jgi:uncharacterized protein YihD (DUF1040 family)
MPSTNYTVKKQEFLNSVVNKIGKQIYSSTAYTNPLKRIKRGFIDNANEIEEIYVARAVGSDYDPNGAGALDRVKPDVKTQYHQVDYEKDFQVTIQDKQVRKGFTTSAGVSRLANEIMESLHTGAEYEEYLKCIEILDTIATNSKYKKEVADVVDNATAKAFTKELKKTIKHMGLRSTDYATYENHCKPSDMVLFLNMDWAVEMDVEMLAQAFNMTKQQIDECTKIEIPSLTVNTHTKAILCDERALQIYDTYYGLEPQRNAKGKFTNHFLSTEKIFSWSNLVNIAVFNTPSA